MKLAYLFGHEIGKDLMAEFGYKQNTVNTIVSNKPFASEVCEIIARRKDGSEYSLGNRPVFFTPDNLPKHFKMRTKTGGERERVGEQKRRGKKK